MLKLPITYEDYNGNTITDIFYFNLSKPELIEMEVAQKNGLKALIEKMIDTKDHNELIKLFKDLVLRSYGEKSDDGKRFIKSDQLRTEFSQTAAYAVLFMDLATNDGSAANFLKGIMPKDMVGEIDKAMLEVATPPAPIPNT